MLTAVDNIWGQYVPPCFALGKASADTITIHFGVLHCRGTQYLVVLSSNLEELQDAISSLPQDAKPPVSSSQLEAYSRKVADLRNAHAALAATAPGGDAARAGGVPTDMMASSTDNPEEVPALQAQLGIDPRIGGLLRGPTPGPLRQRVEARIRNQQRARLLEVPSAGS